MHKLDEPLPPLREELKWPQTQTLKARNRVFLQKPKRGLPLCKGFFYRTGHPGSAVVCVFCGHFVVKAPNLQVVLAKSKKPQKPEKTNKNRIDKTKKTETTKKTEKTKKTKKTNFPELSEWAVTCARVSEICFFSVFSVFLVLSILFFWFFRFFGFCQHYLYVRTRSFDHEMTAKHANNCTPIAAFTWIGPPISKATCMYCSRHTKQNNGIV